MKRLLIAAVLALASVSCLAAVKPKAKAPAKKAVAVRAAKPAAGPVESRYRKFPYVGAISCDVANSNVLFEDNAKVTAYPASVTKLMTALLVLEDVKAGRYQLDTMVTATADAYKCEPSWVGIRPDEQMSVRDLLYALMVESANDVAIVLGVHSAGSIDAFVAKMNARAKALGMLSTVYYNPNGLPPKGNKYPWKNFNVTTAADQAKLAIELVKANPKILEFTSVKTCDLVKTAFGYRVSVTRRTNGGPAATTQLAAGEKLVKVLKNHNNLMVKDKLKMFNDDGAETIDGLKTGYIDAGGSSVVITGSRKGKRVVVVVLGSGNAETRDTEARKLLLDALGAVAW